MSETGFTSLILAAAGGHLEVVKTLVDKVSMEDTILYVTSIRVVVAQNHLLSCLIR